MKKKLLAAFIPLAVLVSIYVYLYDNGEPQKLNDKLIVYTYSSFASSWGPGPDLKRLFKEKTGGNVEFVDAGEAGIIVQRVLLEKNKTKADIVIGLDQFQAQESNVRSLFQNLPKLNLNIDESAPSQDKIQMESLVAYNWSPMTFIMRNSDKLELPKKLEDLTNKNFKGKVILLDPRTSSPGYIFFYWLVEKLGIENVKSFVEKLKPHVYTVTPSWSAGYGLFKKKQSQYIFSYLTSPVYHWEEENDFDYQPLYLEDSLPYHIEYAGILKTSKKQQMAQIFIEFLVDPEAQKIIMNKNYMLPVIAGVTKDSEFEKLKKVKLFDSGKIISRDEVLKAWKELSW